MPEHTIITKITAVLHHRLTEAVVTALRQSGVVDIYIHTGRASVLREPGGVAALLTGRRSLVSTPVDVVTFFVTPTSALDAMRLIAHQGQLTRPGMGSLYSEAYTLHSAHWLCCIKAITPHECPGLAFYHDLVGIYCVVQRGQGDSIARTVLEMGAGVPTITYGTGMGIRDKLGLLRITIPAAKEVLNLVVPSWDAAEVLEAMIAAGRLDLPGRGFISTFPVCHGLTNTKISAGRARAAAASVEQIITAIDTLKSGTQWRAEGAAFSGPRRRFFHGRDLHVLCNDGTGIALVRAAMQVGSSGATIEKLKLLPCPDAHGQQPSPARELCRLLVSAEKLPAIVQAMEQAGALADAAEAMIYHGEAPRAFTYMRPAQAAAPRAAL